MHDISDIERRGVPGVMVASTPFLDAAEVQATRLGFDAARVFVEHPIQDRTDEEMQRLADDAVAALLDALTEP